MYSSRWESGFLYGQSRLEFRVPGLGGMRPYLSARVVGDFGPGAIWRASKPEGPLIPAGPMALSERAIIPAVGVSRQFRIGIYLWAEAGRAISYSSDRGGARIQPDYRGGVAFSRGWGQHLNSESGGWFHEIEADAVFVSQFANDIVYVAQTRTGYTTRPWERAGGLQAQIIGHWNGNADRGREYWANFVEAGPGVRARFSWMPRGMFAGAQYLYGRYTVKEGNPRPMEYRDLRLGVWYAFSW
jgi:hypothetical protein